MKLVRVIKDYDWPNLMRQTRGSKGIWEGVKFELDAAGQCDYAVILNRVIQETTFHCPPQHTWAILQEPPNEYSKPMHQGPANCYRVYTQAEELQGQRYIHSQPALPWHVNRDYDFLKTCGPQDKERDLSFITSNAAECAGHRARLRFLEKLKGKVEFDLYGRGHTYVQDKWDALAPYRYSLVVENFRNPYYWSEKIADCLLSWTMPIYYGCTRISQYFPPEAVISIDIDDPMAVDRINEIVTSDLWSRNMEAVAHARQLILERYQLFPFLVNEIRRFELGEGLPGPESQTINFSPTPGNRLGTRLSQIARREVFRFGQRLGARLKQR